jgi:hypothetical protein
VTTHKYSFPKVCSLAVDPTTADDVSKGYIVGTLLVNSVTGERFVCVDNSSLAAKWVREIDCIDPRQDDVPSHQTMINAKYTNRSVFVTPQIYYQDNAIEYDVTLPGNAFSVGPMSIMTGYTVTVGSSATWSII